MAPAPPELLQAVRNWLEAGHRRDVDYIAAHSHEEDPDFPHTVTSGPDGALTLTQFLDHLRAHQPREVVTTSPRGHVHGDFALVYDEPKIDLLEEGTIDARFTAVLRRIEGVWKVVHAHLSEGVPHEA